VVIETLHYDPCEFRILVVNSSFVNAAGFETDETSVL